ncbi:unnamed protein product [marine sediment metagenome]|uniref:Uncharacterized protein n=1 Tax=marine sediment metagenome TaxID=412755 RepID=X1KDL3_9ZZZZ
MDEGAAKPIKTLAVQKSNIIVCAVWLNHILHLGYNLIRDMREKK